MGRAPGPGRRPARRRPRVLIVTIDDDGPGLPAGRRAEVLERGRRLDEQVPGTGLGLAIVADIALLYGGRLDPRGGARGRPARPSRPARAAERRPNPEPRLNGRFSLRPTARA